MQPIGEITCPTCDSPLYLYVEGGEATKRLHTSGAMIEGTPVCCFECHREYRAGLWTIRGIREQFKLQYGDVR